MQAVSENSRCGKINRFLASPFYIAALMFLCAFVFATGTELLLYGVVAILVIYVCVWGEDLLPLAPIFGFVYISPAVSSNPGRSGDTVFSGMTLNIVIVIGALVLASFAYRIIRDRKQFFSRSHKLLPGLLVLSVSYLLSGIGSEGYGDLAVKNLIFAASQCVAVLVPYWLMSGGVRWDKTRKDYLAWTGVGIGTLLVCQILRIYYINDVLAGGIIYRDRIYAGWGMYNNIGCMLAMMIPFAFSLGIHYKKGVLGALGGTVFLIGVFLTCSRTSIIFGTLGYVACIGLMLFYAKNRKQRTIASLVVLGAFVLLVVALHKPLFRLFSEVLDDVSELDSRFTIYKNGIKEFLRAPVLGTTFYPGQNLAWGWATADVRDILPDRWHNTVIQLLASTGVVGLLAYGFHRIQTIRMAVKFRGRIKWLMVCSVMILLLCSLLDCHFFNVGPTLFYSVTLAFLEKQK